MSPECQSMLIVCNILQINISSTLVTQTKVLQALRVVLWVCVCVSECVCFNKFQNKNHFLNNKIIQHNEATNHSTGQPVNQPTCLTFGRTILSSMPSITFHHHAIEEVSPLKTHSLLYGTPLTLQQWEQLVARYHLWCTCLTCSRFSNITQYSFSSILPCFCKGKVNNKTKITSQYRIALRQNDDALPAKQLLHYRKQRMNEKTTRTTCKRNEFQRK